MPGTTTENFVFCLAGEDDSALMLNLNQIKIIDQIRDGCQNALPFWASRDASSALYWRFSRELPTGRASRSASARCMSTLGALSQGRFGTLANVAKSPIE